MPLQHCTYHYVSPSPHSSIEDEAWTDRLDRRTGTVFYVSPTSSSGQNASGMPWPSQRRSLSVGDLASYSMTSPGQTAVSQPPEGAGLLNSTQSKSARKHMFARMYGSLKKKAARSSSHGRPSDPGTGARDVSSTVNVSAKGEGTCVRAVLPRSSSGLQTKVVHPRASVEGMSATLMQFVKGQPTESRYTWKEYGHLYHAVLYMTLTVEEETGHDSKVGR